MFMWLSALILLFPAELWDAIIGRRNFRRTHTKNLLIPNKGWQGERNYDSSLYILHGHNLRDVPVTGVTLANGPVLQEMLIPSYQAMQFPAFSEVHVSRLYTSQG